MSLTRFLNRPEVKEKFKKEFTKPRFKYSKELLAEPLTTNYSIIGIAFDYLARFHIEKINPSHNLVSRQWVAEVYVQKSILPTDLEDAYNMIINQVKNSKEKFMIDGIVDKFLIKPLIYMSRIETIHRSAYTSIDVFEEVDQNDIQDVINLYDIFIQHDWIAKDVCFLNPVFNEASLMVGGADADLIIDDMLIDFKTIKAAGMKRPDFNQLMGYYLLSEIGGITGYDKKHKINKVSIYSSRYGEMMILNINDIFDKSNLPELIKWFKTIV